MTLSAAITRENAHVFRQKRKDQKFRRTEHKRTQELSTQTKGAQSFQHKVRVHKDQGCALYFSDYGADKVRNKATYVSSLLLDLELVAGLQRAVVLLPDQLLHLVARQVDPVVEVPAPKDVVVSAQRATLQKAIVLFLRNFACGKKLVCGNCCSVSDAVLRSICRKRRELQ